MSQRHRTSEVQLPPKEEVNARKHGERHRVQVELRQFAQQVSAGAQPDDLHEPGARWKPDQHHDGDVAKIKILKSKRRRRHWKTKMWKRRSAVRRAKAEAFRTAGTAGD